MKLLKIFSIICVLVMQSDYLIAQNDKDATPKTGTNKIISSQADVFSSRERNKTDNHSPNKNKKTSVHENVDNSAALSTPKISTSPISTKNKKISVCKDTVMFQHQYEPIIKELNELRDRNKVLQQELQSKEERIAQLEKNDIDKFLNIRDTSIFDSKYLALSLDEIPARSRDFYQLIQDIHDLNNILTAISKMTLDQFRFVGDQLTEAGLKIDAINSYATTLELKITNYLSEEQKQFFRDLVTKYNDLQDTLNPMNSRSIGSNDEE